MYAWHSKVSSISAFAVASLLSVLSCGSVLSFLSVGSTLSILSVASVGSVLSIGSRGCHLGFFSDCQGAYPDAEVAFELNFNDDTWRTMSNCSFDDYQKFKKYESASTAQCDYQKAQCKYKNLKTGGASVELPCEIRRKGFTSWETLEGTPSFKLKFDTDLNLGLLDGVQREVDELTLNNMRFSDSWTHNREVEAYDLFRNIGFEHTPVAAHARVQVYRGKRLVRTGRYALIENVNDGSFLKREWARQHPGEEYDDGGYMLFEADNRGLEFKKGKKNFDDEKLATVGLFETIINREGVLAKYMDEEDTLLFYAGELLTKNWDGACLRYVPNNHYIFVSRANEEEPKVRFIPKGLDRVWQGCGYEVGVSEGLRVRKRPPYCGPVLKLLDGGAERFETLLREAKTNAQYVSASCSGDVGIGSGIAFANVLVSLIAFAAARRWLGSKN